MSYPVIIFGAGASFDSIEDLGRFSETRQSELKNWRPPLTNDIFDRSRFDSLIDKYHEAKYFDGEIFRINENYSLEDLLTDIQEKRAVNEPAWYARLMSLRLYLQQLFTEITKHYFDRSGNYYRLLSELELYSGSKACFVNFNYDLLLERSVFDEKTMANMTNVDEYVEGKIKIIKIHGACNWFRASGQGHKEDADFLSGREYLSQNAKTILQIENHTGEVNPQLPAPVIKNAPVDWDFYEPTTFGGFKNMVKYFVPDLALPLHKKRDFVCPESHIQVLKKELGMADRIIIIGWKAADEFLLGLLKETLSGGNKPIFVVSHTSSEEVAARLKKDYQLRAVPISMGFSEFIRTERCKKVLSAEKSRCSHSEW